MRFGRTRLAALLTVLVAALLTSCHTSPTAAPTEMGREVVDGQFAFVVTETATSPTFDKAHAQGVYLIVSMAVRNVGTEPQFFVWGAQKLTDSTGRKYSARFMDPSRVGEVGDSIDPGLQVSVRLAFDVPDARSTKIILHDSPSSPGVAVNLQRPNSSPTDPADGKG